MKNQISDKARLLHIIEAIEEIHKYVSLCDFDEFNLNSMMKNATVRLLEIIGEAASRLSNDIKSINKDIDWEAIIGFRNIIVHEYFGINYEIVWYTIEQDLDILENRIREILDNLDKIQLF